MHDDNGNQRNAGWLLIMNNAIILFLSLAGGVATTVFSMLCWRKAKKTDPLFGENFDAVVWKCDAKKAIDGYEAKCSIVIIGMIPHVCTVGVKIREDGVCVYRKKGLLVFKNNPMFFLIPYRNISLSTNTSRRIIRSFSIIMEGGSRVKIFFDITNNDYQLLFERASKFALSNSDDFS